MAVKKLRMLNVVCRNEDLDNLLKDLVLNVDCQFENVVKEIEDSSFHIALSEENANEILDMEDITPIEPHKEIESYMQKIEKIADSIGYDKQLQFDYLHESYEFDQVKKEIDDIHCQLLNLTEEKEWIEKQLELLEDMKYVEMLEGIDIDLKKLLNMKYFTAKFGFLTKEKRKKISRNYENIFAVVLHLGTYLEKELYIIISPKKLDVEMERILRSTDFMEIKINPEYLSTPQVMIKKIEEEQFKYRDDLSELMIKSEKYLSEYSQKIDKLYAKLTVEAKINSIKKKVAATNLHSYFSAWIPEGEEEICDKIFSSRVNVLTIYKDEKEVSPRIVTPTLLKNSSFFSPFESMVNMYGVPCYDEIDATRFFGVAYIILFGAMFGDLGQGLLFLIFGFIMKLKKNLSYGDLLMRISVGTMSFGFFYDSFFGYEHLISKVIPLPIFFRPMENINQILLLSVGLGIALLTLSYGFSIFNKLKIKDLSGGLLGKNGLNGMLLFFMMLVFVFELATGQSLIQGWLLKGLIFLSVLVLVFEEPLGNILKGNKSLYKESAGEYYTESGFNILETFLGMMSNSISFIRVGAFALNHVGLFIAFHIMAEMIGSISGNVIMFLLGNVIIIGLEGLIVFIQGLRLFYYELFSKFYRGEGILFSSDKI